jgi:hypothetical protein
LSFEVREDFENADFYGDDNERGLFLIVSGRGQTAACGLNRGKTKYW